MTILFSCAFCAISFTITARLTNTKSVPNNLKESYSDRDIAELIFADNISDIRNTQGYHAGASSADGWNYGGWDYSTECNDVLYSPVPGNAVVVYVGIDGYSGGPYSSAGVKQSGTMAPNGNYYNTEIRIKGEAGEARLLHGRYTVKPGDQVVGGVSPIGYNDNIGNSDGCHVHLTWQKNETWQPPHNQGSLASREIQHTGNSGNYGSILSDYNNMQLRISHYVPALGGTNCDSDCTTMASGDKVAEWALGKNGVYAAACPQEWPFGTRFTLDGQVYSCADRGGWINCYQNGDFDPTLGGHTAQGNYCWVDILGDVEYPYGYKTDAWGFVK